MCDVLHRQSPAPLLGRASELALLHAALTSATPRARAVILTGEAGVGKSRLLGEFVAQAEASGAAVLEATCIEVGDSWPYYPIQDALRRAALATPGDESLGADDHSLAASAQALLEVIRPDRDVTLANSVGAEDGRTLARLHEGIVALATRRPLVLVLDDLQWADSSTRRLTLALLSGVLPAQLLLLASVRTEGLAASDPIRRLLRELQRSRSADVIELEPLERVASDQLVAEIAGSPVSAAMTQDIWRRSGGNPFAIEELVRGAAAGNTLPEALREVLITRVEALPRAAQDLLRAINLAPGPVPHSLLTQVLPYSDDELITAARAAVAASVITADPEGYRLRHQLMAEALDADLLPVERATLHRRFAEALTAAVPPAPIEDLAFHWRFAGDVARALPATMAAAENADRLSAVAEAWSQWQAAVELAGRASAPGGGPLPDLVTPEQWTSLLGRAAEAAHRAGDNDAALRLTEDLSQHEIATTSDPGLRRARYYAAAGRPVLAEQEYERYLAAPGATASGAVAEAAARSAELLVQLGRYAAAADRARLALELADGTPEAASTAVIATGALGFSQAYLDDPDAGRAVLAAAVDAAEASGQADVIGVAYRHLAELLLGGDRADLEQGIEVARRGAELVDRTGAARTHGPVLLATAANGLFRLGRWAEAAQVTSEAIRRDPTGGAAVDLLLSRARITMGLGDLATAERDIASAQTLLADGGGARRQLTLLTLTAGLAMWRGEVETARAAAQAGLIVAGEDVDDAWLLAPLLWHGLRAEAEAVAAGLVLDSGALRTFSDAADRLFQGVDAVPPRTAAVLRGYQLLDLGEISRAQGRSDPDRWQAAATFWQEHQQPYPAAYALLRYAEAHFAQRMRNKEAADALRAAHSIAVSLAAQPLRSEIEQLAGRARVELPVPGDLVEADDQENTTETASAVSPRRAGNPLAGLTPRELEVLAEIAAGLSNREIGERLFISERTVGVHVSHVLAKIQARSRVDATSIYLRFMAEQGNAAR